MKQPSLLVHAFRKLDKSIEILRSQIQLAFRALEVETPIRFQFPLCIFTSMPVMFIAARFYFQMRDQAIFVAKPKPGYFVGKHEVLAASRDRNTVVVNALSPQLHRGLEPSRYGRPGRIPGSCNVSAATLIDPETKAFVPLSEAEAKFAAQGITKDKRVVAYCGGGISATIDLFLLHRLGYDNLTLYDGSMGEWAKDASLPIETG